MREFFTGLTVTSAILAICMGAGEADIRGAAFTLAIIAGVCATVREAHRT
ncbi:hypothetical protein G6L34_08755 [Agrobacterium tumefaciens]|nr:hypothetical protein [Agrobacterium tumefaciens]NTA48183.1 hypothetical protein [Agrobacterium tumefaciens]